VFSGHTSRSTEQIGRLAYTPILQPASAGV
jgi:hypothetical protein